jgi:hypothetical protein
MATFQENFLYPLILLLVGAGVSGVLVAWLTNWWQDRRRERDIEVERNKKALEIKVDIASKMAEIIASAFATVELVIIRKKQISTPAEKDAADEDTKKLIAGAYVVQSMLKCYSSEETINQEWSNYSTALTSLRRASSLYFFKDRNPDETGMLRKELEEIKKYFSKKNLINFPDKNKMINWEGLTTANTFTFNHELWMDVDTKIRDQGDKIIEDFLKSRIKGF